MAAVVAVQGPRNSRRCPMASRTILAHLAPLISCSFTRPR